MCFLLYAGTTDPIPRKSWNQQAPDISVQSLKGNEEKIRGHFSKSEVQNIGSTSGCGCDFPSAMFQNGGWPEIEYCEKDEEQRKSEQCNLESLVALLSALKDEWIELYGVWAGDHAEIPVVHEEISLKDLLDARFCFKERVFYKVRLSIVTCPLVSDTGRLGPNFPIDENPHDLPRPDLRPEQVCPRTNRP